MRKTSVYLSDEEAHALRVFAEAAGKSQAEIIRDAVRTAVSAEPPPQRVFHSMGMGHGGGSREYEWDADELYAEVMGLADIPDAQQNDPSRPT